MVAFLTLFLGLVFGPQGVEVRVGPEVARVELRLDGATVAELTGAAGRSAEGSAEGEATWRATVDFGPEPVPGRLVAVAFDVQDREIGRVSQNVNRPRPSAELEVTVSGVESGDRAEPVVRFRWEDVLGRELSRVVVSVDGTPLETVEVVAAERRGEAVLHTLPTAPGLDPEIPHVLQVEIDLDDGARLRREVAFGAAVDAVTEGLTAVPVRRVGDGPSARSLPSIRTKDGTDARVLALEEGGAVVFVVPDSTARAALRLLVSGWLQRRPNLRFGGDASVLDRFGDLGDDVELRVLDPRVRPSESPHLAFEVFPVSPPSESANWVERLVLGSDPDPEAGSGEEGESLEPAVRLADAVAVAGLRAAADHRRRAVVLLTSADDEDLSRLRAGPARRFLARLGVPLEVWALEPEGWRRDGSGIPELEASRVIREMQDLREATRSLQAALGEQRILWLEGTHSPADLHLDSVSGLEPLASSPPVPVTTRAVGETLEDALRSARRTAAAEVGRGGTAGSAVPPRVRAARRLLGPAAEGEPRDWGGFRVWTDAGEQEVERLAVVGEGVASAYRALHGGDESVVTPNGEDHLVLFADPDGYRRFAGVSAADLSWQGHAGDDGVAALPVLEDGDESAALLLHEAAHLLNRRRFPARALPPWLEEGLAEGLAFSLVEENGAVRPRRLNGEVRRAPEGHPRLERFRVTGALAALGRLARAEDLPSLAELTTAPADAFHDPEDRRLRYDLAAYWVRRLALEHGDDWLRFLDAVAAGVAANADALSSFLGVLPDRLERDFREWLRGEARRRGVAG